MKTPFDAAVTAKIIMVLPAKGPNRKIKKEALTNNEVDLLGPSGAEVKDDIDWNSPTPKGH